MWYRYAMEYYSALKRKKILTYATTWMNHKNTMLSKISQTQKEKYCMIPLYEILKVVKMIEIQSRMVVARGRGKWQWRAIV